MTKPRTVRLCVGLGALALLAACSGGTKTGGSASTTTPPTNETLSPNSTGATSGGPKLQSLQQPAVVSLPSPPAAGLRPGSRGPVVRAYQQRLKDLHFDPGPVDGVFSQDTGYAVVAVEKLSGLDRDGVIGPKVRDVLEHFTYKPALPDADADRVEINLDTQVLTVFRDKQPILVTTTSTGSGEHFCGGGDGCQYAITPAGHYHFQFLHRGWDAGKLGKMWNPYYFNGGIAVHGLPSVPSYPASHGCARIPMDIANYFPSLVHDGESVYVVGTPMKAGDLYVGPVTTTTSSTTSTTVPRHTTTTTKPRHTTTTTRPHTTTTVHKPKP